MKNTTITLTEFSRALLENTKTAIASAKRQGTVRASRENLLQIVDTPSTSLAGAPTGSLAAYRYRQIFFDLCQSPEVKPFLLT
jgi:hypothetical protein